MRIALAGISHRTAPITLREQLTVAPSRLADATRAVLRLPGVREALILSTCNRTELTVACDGQTPDLSGFFAGFSGIGETEVLSHMYEYGDIDAAQHLFRVASSLDSLVLGESQILGQVKNAYSLACSVGAIGPNLQLLLQSAFATAKKVRRETRIGSAPVSVASIAVELIGRLIGPLRERQILLVGTGEMSSLAAARLLRHGPKSVTIASRKFENALHLAAELGGLAVRFEDVLGAAAQADVVITATGSEGYLFRREDAGELMSARTSRPLFFLDIAVPRDVDPGLRSVEGIFVYDLDSLQSVSLLHRESRSCEAEKAELIIAQEVILYNRRAAARDIAPTISAVQTSMESLTQTELKKFRSGLRSLTPGQRRTTERLLRGVANRVLHSMIRSLKRAAATGDVRAIETIRTLLDPPRSPLIQVDTASCGDETVDDSSAPSVNAHTARAVAAGASSPLFHRLDAGQRLHIN